MMHTWAELETALRDRPRWRRVGREWHGPCPVRGLGENTCWFAEGDSTPVRGGYRKCGGRLVGAAFREHLESVGEGATTAPADVWAAGVARQIPPPAPTWSSDIASGHRRDGSRRRSAGYRYCEN